MFIFYCVRSKCSVLCDIKPARLFLYDCMPVCLFFTVSARRALYCGQMYKI